MTPDIPIIYDQLPFDPINWIDPKEASHGGTDDDKYGQKRPGSPQNPLDSGSIPTSKSHLDQADLEKKGLQANSPPTDERDFLPVNNKVGGDVVPAKLGSEPKERKSFGLNE